nr:uncharacterized protein LOC111999528 [Quercus suber]
MTILAWNCRGLGSALAVRTLADEVRSHDPLLIFLAETKTGESRMKGIRNKLEYTQGITVPSDGRSGGLAMMWKEGSDVRFRSCSNSHIDVEVHGSSTSTPWRATGFYGHPDAGKRFISWQLLELLKHQYSMPWVVFGDFNEITHSNEKLGWLDRDAKQMEEFRECLNRCELIDLGFIGQKYTWCNGRGREQRTKIRLDRMVATEEWMNLFPEARVRHVAMSISDHCLLMLNLKRKQNQKRGSKRFFFEAMWTRDERCREIIEGAWEPDWAGAESGIIERIKRCQDHLLKWNWNEFGNVNKVLK